MGGKTEKQKFRVWYTPQVPCEPYYVKVDSQKEGILVAKAIIGLSMFEYKHRIKPDYSDSIGMEIFEDGERSERYNEEGDSIDDILE